MCTIYAWKVPLTVQIVNEGAQLAPGLEDLCLIKVGRSENVAARLKTQINAWKKILNLNDAALGLHLNGCMDVDSILHRLENGCEAICAFATCAAIDSKQTVDFVRSL